MLKENCKKITSCGFELFTSTNCCCFFFLSFVFLCAKFSFSCCFLLFIGFVVIVAYCCCLLLLHLLFCRVLATFFPNCCYLFVAELGDDGKKMLLRMISWFIVGIVCLVVLVFTFISVFEFLHNGAQKRVYIWVLERVCMCVYMYECMFFYCFLNEKLQVVKCEMLTLGSERTMCKHSTRQ